MVRQLSAAGMSTREVAAVTGAARNTIAADLKVAQFEPSANANASPLADLISADDLAALHVPIDPGPLATVHSLYPGGGYPPDPMDPMPELGNFPVDEDGNVLRTPEEIQAFEVWFRTEAEIVDEDESPAPKPFPLETKQPSQRRSPLPETAASLTGEIFRLVQKLEKVATNDRFATNKASIKDRCTADLNISISALEKFRSLLG